MDAEGQYVLPKVIEMAGGDCELFFSEQLTPQCRRTRFITILAVHKNFTETCV